MQMRNYLQKQIKGREQNEKLEQQASLHYEMDVVNSSIERVKAREEKREKWVRE